MSILRTRIQQEMKSLNPELVPGLTEALDRVVVTDKNRNRFDIQTSKDLPPATMKAVETETGAVVELRYGRLPGVPTFYPAEDESTDPADEETDPRGTVQHFPLAWSELWEMLYAAQIQHPRVPAIRELEDISDGVRAVRPWVGGRRLSDWAEGQDRKAKMRVFEGVCTVLAAAHGRGVIHRNLSPQVIWVEDDGAVWVDGWKMSKNQETPAWRAPEQLTGTGEGPRSDLYSLALMLRWLLTGLAPAEGKTLPETLALKYKPLSIPDNAEIPPALRQLCMECLAMDPGARPVDARIFFARFLPLGRRL